MRVTFNNLCTGFVQGAVAILHRGEKDLQRYEDEYITKFSNPFPAAVRGTHVHLNIYGVYKSK